MRRLGDLVRFVCDFDYHPYTSVVEGETGTIVWIDVLTGALEFLLHKHHPGLRQWFNTLLVVPGETDDLEECLEYEPVLLLCYDPTHETVIAA